nr:uncharacterized protein LOC109188342 [Ipomoea trifida]
MLLRSPEGKKTMDGRLILSALPKGVIVPPSGTIVFHSPPHHRRTIAAPSPHLRRLHSPSPLAAARCCSPSPSSVAVQHYCPPTPSNTTASDAVECCFPRSPSTPVASSSVAVVSLYLSKTDGLEPPLLNSTEVRRLAGNLGFLYESEVLNWSIHDFVFTYSVSSSQIYGGVLLQSPLALDNDNKKTFCCYLFPGNKQSKKEVVFVVDISGSMRGKPLEATELEATGVDGDRGKQH